MFPLIGNKTKELLKYYETLEGTMTDFSVWANTPQA